MTYRAPAEATKEGDSRRVLIKMFLENEREGGGCVVRVRLAQTSTFASQSRAVALGYCQVWYGIQCAERRRAAGRSPTRVADKRAGAGHSWTSGVPPAKEPPSASVIFAYVSFSFAHLTIGIHNI